MIGDTDVDMLLEDWNQIAGKNIERCIHMIDDDFINTPQSSPFLNDAVTTLSASKLKTGLKANYYDLAMDESSQTDIISAIPILFRSKVLW